MLTNLENYILFILVAASAKYNELLLQLIKDVFQI